MPFFVYIIYSPSSGVYYKGFTANPEKRLYEHNQGLSRYTSKKCPWKLVYLEEYDSKTEAVKREKAIKRYNHAYIEILVNSTTNLVQNNLKK